MIPTGQDLRSSVSISPESPLDSSVLHSKMMSASTMPVIVNRPSSHADPNSSSDSNESFTTAFAMLLYNVCYLAYTQSVDIPLSQAGDVLSNLWAVCCSGDLGRSAYVVPRQSGTHFYIAFGTGVHMQRPPLSHHQLHPRFPSTSHSYCRQQLRALPGFAQ